MASWNSQIIVDNYSDAADNVAKSWYEEKVNIPAIISLLPKKKIRVLDFGCGPGNFTQALSKNYTVAGADASGVMIEKAKQKYPGTDFFIWDAQEPLPAPHSPFDAIITKLTLEFIEDLETTAKNLHTALAENGVIVISVQHPLLAISMHPEETLPYWGTTSFDVQIGTINTVVTKIHRNIGEYTAPFIKNGFEVLQIDEPEIKNDISEVYQARPIDIKFPKRLNISFRKLS